MGSLSHRAVEGRPSALGGPPTSRASSGVGPETAFVTKSRTLLVPEPHFEKHRDSAWLWQALVGAGGGGGRGLGRGGDHPASPGRSPRFLHRLRAVVASGDAQ